jgi:hypothetical protein
MNAILKGICLMSILVNKHDVIITRGLIDTFRTKQARAADGLQSHRAGAQLMRALRSIAAAALAAAAFVSAPVQAKDFVVVEPAEIFAAYQVVCLAKPGDIDAQIAAAKAAPFGMVLAETSEDGSQRFDNDRLFAAMRKDAKNHFCMVGGRLADGTTLETGAAAGASVLDKKGARMTSNATMVIWSDVAVKPVTIYMYTHTVKGPVTIGSFLSGVSQGQ